MKIGKNVAISPGSYFNGLKVNVGNDSWINSNCFFDGDNENIHIGSNCGIGMQVLFCTSSHEIGYPGRRGGPVIKKPVIIGNGCWIGARATILPGVTIGEGCIVAAGSVVTKDCLPHGLYAGVPAKRVRELPILDNDFKVL
ncbi:hypothetical protein CHH58_10380 [Terribacillus saccharophilus]|nr:hypothetical protein CHH58_10380 [Terribacillus saccharophilus]